MIRVGLSKEEYQLVTVPRTKPIEPTQRLYDRNQGVGQIFKATHDAKVPEKGIRRIVIVPITMRKDERTGRYRYVAGFKEFNKSWGGRFVKAADAEIILQSLKKKKKRS